MRKLAFLTLLLLLSFAVQANQESVTDRYLARALQGDLRGTGPEMLPDAELAGLYRARFTDQNEDSSPATGDALADAVVETYRNYWSRTLIRQLSLAQGEEYLERALMELLPPEPGAEPAGVFTRVADELQRRGFYVLDTPAPPLRDLFLWRTEENARYTVRLTDRSQPVRVTFIKDVYSLGWKEFATLGLLATTGWVEGDRLYCIDDSYNRNSENFRVSYLKHEARHLADYRRFPGLSSAELEYRAKLTELAFATQSAQRLLADFTLKSADNPDSPHAFANHRVTRDMHLALYDEPVSDAAPTWQGITPSRINRAARRLLELDTRALASNGR